MLQMLRTISWRHARRHSLRTALTFFGMSFGVAVIVAIALVNRSLIGSFQSTVEQIAGKAVLQVANGEAGVPEFLYPRIRDTRGVKDAVPVVEGFLPVTGITGARLYVLGLDLLQDTAVRDHQLVNEALGFEQALDFIAAPDSIAITESFAQRVNLDVGASLSLLTTRGKQNYTVRALLKETGTAKVFGGNFAIMDLPVAQRAFGKENRLDVVDVTVEDGETIDEVQARLQRNAQGAADVERPQKRGEQVEQLLTSFRVGLFFVSLIALFVGFFLIYNTMSVSVTQRRAELGILRCLGMRRSELLRWILAEALVLAIGASFAGVVLGWLLAQAALIAVGETVANLFSSIDLATAPLSSRELILALTSGVAVAAVAALHPAREAIQVGPLESARQPAWQPGLSGLKSWATRLALVCLALAPTLIALAPMAPGPVERFSVGIFGMLVFLLALAFFCPAFIFYGVGWLWRVIRLPEGAGRSAWLEMRLAAENLTRSPVRAGISVATMIISLAAIFTIAAFVNSVRGSLLAWVDQMVTADLIVSSGARTAGPKNVPLREDPAAGLRSLPGVNIVDLYRLVRSNYHGKPILIESFSAGESAPVRRLPMADGDGDKTLRDMAAGRGVVVSESFHSKFGKGRGDKVELITPSGPVTFKILGVYIDYSSDIGSVLIDRALYKKYWADDLVDAFDLWLAPGANERVVIERIQQTFGDRYELFVSTHRELREAVVDIMEQSFVVNYAVEIVAVVVAVFSVINTLLASVLDRRREVGVLRAIGATQAQIRRIVLFESAWMGVFGGTLGLLAGTIMAYHHVVYNTKVLTGWTFQFYYPYGIAVLAWAAAVLLCLAAGYVPAKHAAAAPIVSAIGYE
jgi:putative ABC transport system permease protein